MNFIYTNQPVDDAAAAVATTLTDHLSRGERVLLLLSGGSGAAIALAAARQLDNTDLSQLFVSMTDERYGPVGHPDENWQQLLDAGFALPGATTYRPLTGESRAATTAAFATWLSEQLPAADYKLGIFGFGTDGHTAGIKPHSPAVSSTELAAAFTGDDFERITITFETIRQLDEAVVQASGPEKRPVIRDLLAATLSPGDQPAQILRTIPRTTLYTNNHKEELSK